MSNFVSDEDLDNLLNEETRKYAILEIFEQNHMDCMDWGKRIEYEHKERKDEYEMNWTKRYLGEDVKIKISLNDHKVQSDPSQTSFVFFFQGFDGQGHLVVFHEPNPRVVLEHPTKFLFAHDPDFVCIYSYGTSIPEFNIQVYRNVYTEPYLTVRDYLRIIVTKDYFLGCAFLDTHPEMTEWLKIYQNRYMNGRTNSIAFECESRNTLKPFLTKVLAIMEQYPSTVDQLAHFNDTGNA